MSGTDPRGRFGALGDVDRGRPVNPRAQSLYRVPRFNDDTGDAQRLIAGTGCTVTEIYPVSENRRHRPCAHIIFSKGDAVQKARQILEASGFVVEATPRWPEDRK